ncbi:type IV pilus secretin PilQ [Thiohalophilus thiocyanatoxydans]|uniref:Type IV pilus assembly protein PilQ n=1 Tax=Thiohalophilus thiocyanatoxydans TaxID=381308 RepID=A0A4R8J1A7_9GAMM|nr:type IV pilus secretin PilQ [Thiohalophilus thiocyanatoxydans]TDY03959.1 type IV pilus assembly protein PilQ [Thiohalophilus thiocyanatoxydans]
MINQSGYASRIMNATGILSVMLLMFLTSMPAQAQNSLNDIGYSTLPGDKVQIKLTLDSPLEAEPASFTIDNPARIAFDLPDTRLNLDERSKDIGIGVARSVNVAEAGNRTRVVLNLSNLVGYNTVLEGNDVIITLNESGKTSFSQAGRSAGGKTMGQTGSVNVLDLDFRRGEQGEGRVEMTLADPNTAVDMKRRGSEVVVTLKNSLLDEDLERRVDVLDFATPVSTVDAFNQGDDVRVVINTRDDFEHIAYQADQKLTIDIKPVVEEEEDRSRRRKEYTGEKLSLNFQNIEVRAVLQLIADFTGINMVTSDTVSGEVTLRLKNVPWDQALDIILKTKGLAKRESGNVMLIAPAEEIAAREKMEMEANKQVEALAPLISETIQVNYAKASEVASLLKQKGSELLSERGNVSVDERTNKLLVQETAERIDEIISLVDELDVPVRQVLIESRIVLASTNFSKEVGVRFGVSRNYVGSDGRERAVSGNLSATENLINNETLEAPGRWNVNLPAASGSAGTIGMALARLPFGTLVELELSAAQAEGETEIVSSPRVITANQQEAVIESGQEIPYQEASSSGATSVSFKKAVLSLTVTPQITPDDRVIMDLAVTSDNPDFGNLVLGVPPITTQNVQTQVLINNGETVVLGGVYEQTKSNTINRVPFFGDLPVVGALFRSKSQLDEKNELLIFVTPKIVKDDMRI